MDVVVQYLLIIGIIVLVTGLVITVMPSLEAFVLTGESRRKHALDGSRGILALSVMIHHLMLGHVLAGVPSDASLKENHFVSQLGSVPVALFFMVSSYLFAGRLLASDGRLNLPQLFYGRFMRIVPLYLVAVTCVVAVAFAFQGFRFVQPEGKVANEIARHLLFDFVPRFEINGFGLAKDLLGPVWTLRYEWLFYFLLPVMAFAYRQTRHVTALYLPLVAVAFFYDPRFYFFAAGLASAQLSSLAEDHARPLWPLAGAVSLIVLFTASFQSTGAMEAIEAMLLVPTLVAIIQGHRWFALLGSRSLRFLGEISFSIYLLHGPTLFVVSHGLAIDWHGLGPIEFVAAAVSVGLLVVSISVATFLLVEKPFMHARLPRLLSSRASIRVEPIGYRR